MRTLFVFILLALLLLLTAGLLAAESQPGLPRPAPANIPRLAVPGQPRQINDLIEHAIHFDGQEVTLTGEAIGDLMERGPVAWLNIADTSGAIGVYGPAPLFGGIEQLGRYRARGDVVEVTGTFHRCDPKQGGDTVIAASRITVVEPGRLTRDDVSTARLMVALFCSLISALLISLVWRGREDRPTVAAKGAHDASDFDYLDGP